MYVYVRGDFVLIKQTLIVDGRYSSWRPRNLDKRYIGVKLSSCFYLFSFPTTVTRLIPLLVSPNATALLVTPPPAPFVPSRVVHDDLLPQFITTYRCSLRIVVRYGALSIFRLLLAIRAPKLCALKLLRSAIRFGSGVCPSMRTHRYIVYV